VGASLGTGVGAALGTGVGAALGTGVGAALGTGVGAALGTAVGVGVGFCVMSQSDPEKPDGQTHSQPPVAPLAVPSFLQPIVPATPAKPTVQGSAVPQLAPL